MEKLYSVKKFVVNWNGKSDTATRTLISLGSDLSWKEAKELKKKNKHSEIFTQRVMNDKA